jgi:hypothetical protein
MLNPFSHRKILKKGMPGRATIVEMGALDRGGTSFNLPMTLQVHVEGLTPYEVEGQWMVKAKDTVGLSGSIPVKVDREEHDKVAIDWDGVRAEYQQHKAQRREALATGGSTIDQLGGAGFGDGMAQAATPTVDMRNDPELRSKIEQVLGRKLTPGTSETVADGDPEMQMRIMQVVQEHAAQKAAGAAPASGFAGDSGADDPVAKLERLARLRDSGALTDKEFEREKKKLLGES